MVATRLLKSMAGNQGRWEPRHACDAPRDPILPLGAGVIVSVHSTALPPWSKVPQGDLVAARPTVPKLPWNSFG